MVIVWGSGMYGKVDEVPRLFHVVTSFGHLYYIPLIPLGSYAILSQSGSSFHGIKIPLSGKSIIIAWLRALLVLGAIGCTIYGLVRIAEDPTEGLVAIGAAGMAVVAVIYSKKARGINQASYARAVHLAELLNVTDEARLMIEVAYGQMTAEEAAAKLAVAAEQEAAANPTT